MGQFSVEKPVAPGSVLSGNQQIAFYLYEANRWIYGDGAFGLRLLAWIGSKAPDALVVL
jgi:hypothetical protein